MDNVQKVSNCISVQVEKYQFRRREPRNDPIQYEVGSHQTCFFISVQIFRSICWPFMKPANS
jgi:hypothetical protein